MSHAQTGTIMEAQLPVTLRRNEELAELLGDEQEELVEGAAAVCVNCHAPIGAQFVDDPLAVLPLNEGTESGGPAVEGGGQAINADGISCSVCHTQSEPFEELAGGGRLDIDPGTKDDYGTVYGPLFDDPAPLPVRVHDIGDGEGDFWDDPITTSIACGACHNVKLDIDGDGLSPFRDSDDGDDDGDFQLNGNELDNQDGTLDDLVLQTTFDEWQDYVAGYDDTIGDRDDVDVNRPMGCIDCHMPSNPDGAEEPVVDAAPGALSIPDRPHRKHSFVGVDYDLDPTAYTKLGLPIDTVNEILAERAALLESAVVLEVTEPIVVDEITQQADVIVTNNLLGHSFPTGFAFARQFWIEVTAESSSGQDVCVVDIFAAQGIDSPCGSGVIDDRDDVLPQCDPASVAGVLGIGLADVSNGTIQFAEPVAADSCDPWLANFQKILTDGDPDGDGIFREVTYQSFLADIVKIRERAVVFGEEAPQRFDALQSVRLTTLADGTLVPTDSVAIPYQFDTTGLAPGDTITVTARMRFRHLPPEFIRGLAAEQEDLDNVPDSARIDDPDDLVDNLVVTDIVTAESGEGPVLECEGPQNEPGATILSCIDDVEGDGAVDVESAAALDVEMAEPAATAAIVGGMTMLGAAVVRPRRRRAIA
jgi:hypothetical protein